MKSYKVRRKMKHRTEYRGTYTDEHETVPIVLENDFETLYTEIDGVKFEGYEFSSMFIRDIKDYSVQQLSRFSFTENDFEGALWDCKFNIIIPQILINNQNNLEFQANLNLECILKTDISKSECRRKKEVIKLSIIIDEQIYVGEDTLIEGAFDKIRDQFSNKFQFKNCYGCTYGDYSVYGQSTFGTMLCYISEKEQYKKVVSKDEYMNLKTDKLVSVQEIYCCKAYEKRKLGMGYRG